MIPSHTPPILESREVSFCYSDGSRGLENCSLAIERGSRTAVMGRNGAGKTTLFLHLNGILRPQTGTIIYNGKELDYSRSGLRQCRSEIGLLFQNPDSQLFSASVMEDVSFGPLNLGLEKNIVRKRVEEALSRVGMSDFAGKPVHNLSFGQKKRVCIAGILAMQPNVILLDEPMSGLDIPMQKELLEILEDLHEDGVTLIIATHDMDFAYKWGDSIFIMSEGRSEWRCDSTEIYSSLDKIAEFGIGVPEAARLYRELLIAGKIKPASKPPRTFDELISLIKAT